MLRYLLFIIIILSQLFLMIPKDSIILSGEETLISSHMGDSDIDPDLDSDGQSDASENSYEESEEMFGIRSIAHFSFAQNDQVYGRGRLMRFSDVPRVVLKAPPKA